jgi:hypothetical protein
VFEPDTSKIQVIGVTPTAAWSAPDGMQSNYACRDFQGKHEYLTLLIFLWQSKLKYCTRTLIIRGGIRH